MKYIIILFLVLSFGGCQQALDDLNKSLEETRQKLNQNLTNTNSAYNSNQTNGYSNYKQENYATKVEKTPKFNSLAEEAEYNKQQENIKKLDKERRQQLKEQIISDIEQFSIKRANYYKKFLVKNTDSLASIDEKFKNKDNIMLEKQKDFDLLKMEMAKFYQLKIKYPDMNLSQYFNFSITKMKNSYGNIYENQLDREEDINNINRIS